MSDQAKREYVKARLSDYKALADQDMYEGFEAFLTGELGNKTESSFVNVPYVDPSTRHLCQDRAARPEILSNVQTKCIPWQDNHLLHIPGAHGYLEGEYRKKKAFDIYIGTLYAMGPLTMDQAWHYYKFIVKQQKPADRDFNSLVDWNSELRYGGEERSNWDSNLKPRHRGGGGGGGGGSGSGGGGGGGGPT
ncbi:hypothetical protein T492DRAFT_835834 [Pavlovales sp. CCMP2436]|nr:hypothetical protein T492DRAFT_835834 [Pavlovales sp. CCMP2436]